MQEGGLDLDLVKQLLECFSYEERIDHILFGQMLETIEKMGAQEHNDVLLYKAIYYFNTGGYLTAVDSLKAVQGSLVNSTLAKDELFKLITGEESSSKIDSYAKEQLVEAIKSLEGKIDVEFYELTDMFAKPEEE